MSSLLSLLSATTGMKIVRDVTTGNHTTQFEYGSITENISVSSNCCYDVANSTFHTDKPSGMKIERDVTTGNSSTEFEYGSITENISVSSNCCYDVANSTFHTDKPSGCYSCNGPKSALNPHHVTSSPEISIPRSYGNMQEVCVGSLALLESQPKNPNMMQHSVDMHIVHFQQVNISDFRNTDAYHYVQSLPATGTYLRALPSNGQEPANEYLQLQQSANPLQSVDKEGSSPPLLPYHHNPITPFPTNGHDALATAGAKSVDRRSQCTQMEVGCEGGFVRSVSTTSEKDTAAHLSSSPTTLSGCDVSKELNDDEVYEEVAIGVVRHVTRPRSSEDYSDVCVGVQVQVATGVGL